MNLTGSYRVTSSGSVVAEYKNVVTYSGVVAINQFLAGVIPQWAGSIGVGALSKTPTASVTSFAHEIHRFPITLRSYTYDSVSNSWRQAVKASLPAESAFSAYELGVFPMTVDPTTFPDNYQITDFSESSGSTSSWYIGGAPTVFYSGSPSPRVGLYGINVSPGDTASTIISLNTSQYGNYDGISVLIYIPTATAGGTLKISLYDDSIVPLTWVFSGSISSASGKTFFSAPLSASAKPDLFSDSTYGISINYAGDVPVILDQAKFIKNNTKVLEEKLISYSSASPTISSPGYGPDGSQYPLFVKVYGQPMEVEYYINVTGSYG